MRYALRMRGGMEETWSRKVHKGVMEAWCRSGKGCGVCKDAREVWHKHREHGGKCVGRGHLSQ